MRVSCLAVLLAMSVGAVAAFAADNTGTTMDDSTITASIKASLLKDQHLKAFDIHVSTDHGKVRLTGMVDSNVEKADAERIAKETEGVRDIQNDLKTK